MSRNWIAVASAEHVSIGRAGGFMQVCHGRAAPLRRIRPGDLVAYYSPVHVFDGNGDKRRNGRNSLQAFTAIGRVMSGEPYQLDMGGGFKPFRRDVSWFEANRVPIRPMLERLEFSTGKRHWAYPLRFGIFGISDHDMRIIAAAMGVESGGKARPDQAV